MTNSGNARDALGRAHDALGRTHEAFDAPDQVSPPGHFYSPHPDPAEYARLPGPDPRPGNPTPSTLRRRRP